MLYLKERWSRYRTHQFQRTKGMYYPGGTKSSGGGRLPLNQTRTAAGVSVGVGFKEKRESLC